MGVYIQSIRQVAEGVGAPSLSLALSFPGLFTFSDCVHFQLYTQYSQCLYHHCGCGDVVVSVFLFSCRVGFSFAFHTAQPWGGWDNGGERGRAGQAATIVLGPVRWWPGGRSAAILAPWSDGSKSIPLIPNPASLPLAMTSVWSGVFIAQFPVRNNSVCVPVCNV